MAFDDGGKGSGFWDLKTNRLVAYEGPGQIAAVNDATGRMLARRPDGCLTVFQGRTNERLWESCSNDAMWFSHDGHYTIGNRQRMVVVREADTGKVRFEITTAGTQDGATSEPDGSALIVAFDRKSEREAIVRVRPDGKAERASAIGPQWTHVLPFS